MSSRNDAKKSILVDGKSVIPEINQPEIRVFPNQAGSITIEQDNDELVHGGMLIIVAPQNVDQLCQLIKNAAKDLSELNEA